MNHYYKKINWFYWPALLLVVLFVAYPLVNSFIVSLTKWNGYSQNKTFIGFENYIRMFQDKAFLLSLKNTLLYAGVSTILQQIFGLALALLVDSKLKGRNVLRTIIYLPAMISGLVMGYILYFFFQYDNGVLNDIIGWFGHGPIDWMADSTRAVSIIIIANVWQFTGKSMIIYLAGLQGVPQAYYEAAKIDGAGKWQLFGHITLPTIFPSIVSSTIFNLIGGLKLFDVVKALTNGGPAGSTHSLATYLTYEYFEVEKAGYAGAIGVFTFVFIMIISTVTNGTFRKVGERLQ